MGDLLELAAREHYPELIGDLHLGEKRSAGHRLCTHGHEVTKGHPLYWPQMLSQYDDSDPYCLPHAIDRAEDYGILTRAACARLRARTPSAVLQHGGEK